MSSTSKVQAVNVESRRYEKKRASDCVRDGIREGNYVEMEMVLLKGKFHKPEKSRDFWGVKTQMMRRL
jgi:hypothetical protein